jgi:hypothetical protein
MVISFSQVRVAARSRARASARVFHVVAMVRMRASCSHCVIVEATTSSSFLLAVVVACCSSMEGLDVLLDMVGKTVEVRIGGGGRR